MASPKPQRPLPVIAPSSVWVKPNSRPQSSRMPLRMEKPTPAAIRVMKLARKSRLWPAVPLVAGVCTGSGDFLGFVAGSSDVDLLIATLRLEVEDQRQIS